MPDLATASPADGILWGAALIGLIVCIGIIAAFVSRWIELSDEIDRLTADLDTAERDRLQTEAAYRRLRAQAPARRGQDTPRTSADPRLRVVDGGER